MPQGTVIPVRPTFTNEYEWIDHLKKFLGQELEIGVVETCEVGSSDEDIKVGDKLLYILDKGQLPDVVKGNCGTTDADGTPTKVNFKYKRQPFKYINEIKL